MRYLKGTLKNIQEVGMSKILLFAAFLLLSATWVVAQDSSTSGSQSGQSGSSSSSQSSGMSSGSESSVEGCLSGSAGSYTLTSSTGTTYQLTGENDDLGKHVNQQVRVTGTQSASSAASSSSSPSSSSSSSQPSFKVSKVSKISDTCSSSNK
jgi:Protein of unknown function (DUF5818)